MGRTGSFHLSSMVAPVHGAEDEYLLFNDTFAFDWFRGTVIDKDWLTQHVRPFLQAVDPDVVHVQHTMHLGFDLLREIRTSLPGVPIVHTLHEFAAICLRDGQMLRADDDTLCTGASPRACHECFPEHSARDFFLREQFVKANFAAVDLFISPSRFLRDRYVEWGIHPSRIVVEENGRTTPTEAPRVVADRPRRDRLGSSGSSAGTRRRRAARGDGTARSDGARRRTDPPSACAAGRRCPAEGPGRVDLGHGERAAAGGPTLRLHGANLDLQVGSYRDRIAELIAASSDRVSMVGSYRPAELAELMAQVDWVVVPSIWWENAPLVIRRPSNTVAR